MYDTFLYLITRAFTLRVCPDMSDQMDWLLRGTIEAIRVAVALVAVLLQFLRFREELTKSLLGAM